MLILNATSIIHQLPYIIFGSTQSAAVMQPIADWQKQLTRCNSELGFRHVRFHGLLSDDMGTLVNEENELVYSFFNADQICDFLLSIGMRPFTELSFMPNALASGLILFFITKEISLLPKIMKTRKH